LFYSAESQQLESAGHLLAPIDFSSGKGRYVWGRGAPYKGLYSTEASGLLMCRVLQGLSALGHVSSSKVGATVLLSALGLSPAQLQEMIVSALRSLIFLNCKDLQQQ